MSGIRILLADDHALVRAGIRALLEAMPGIEIVGEAKDGQEALAKIAESRPDVVLMDIAMRGLGGLEAASRIAAEWPDVKVVILSMHANEEYVAEALKAGAAGYLLKDCAAAELKIALDAVARGETYLSPVISRAVIDGFLGRGASAPAPPDPLTERQREVLTLLAEGKSVKEIAHLLGVSVKTVETHRTAVMTRLDLHDLPSLVKYAMRMGLIERVR